MRAYIVSLCVRLWPWWNFPRVVLGLEAIHVGVAQNAVIEPIDIMVELRAKHNNLQNLW